MTVTDHPEYRAFVSAMRAAPDDDLPRLVAADWLEEHGEGAWAEFVRVSCEWAADQDKKPALTAAVLWRFGAFRKRHDALLTPANAVAWFSLPEGPEYGRLALLYSAPQSGGPTWGWVGPPVVAPPDRGFPSAVTCPADWWLTHGDAVYAAQPVTRVTLTTHPLGIGAPTWGAAPAHLSALWPGVEFTVLPADPRHSRPVASVTGQPVTMFGAPMVYADVPPPV